MYQIPKLSIITPTFNSGKHIKKFLQYITNQDYPRNKLEIIIADGGSTDGTLEIAKKYDVRIINNPLVLAEPGIYYGINKATGQIITVLAVDNFFEDRHAFKKIVELFKNRDIYAAFPKHFSKKDYSLFSKYVNTFTDPFNHFIYGYAANARTFNKVYRTIKHTEAYDVYDYNSVDIKPILALAQGFSVRRSFALTKRNKYDDLSPILDIIRANKQIAYAHSILLYHDTIRDFSHFFNKQRWAAKNAFAKKTYGIYQRQQTLTQWQKIKIMIFPFYSLSIFIPIIRSVYKTIVDKEPLWLFHPIINTLTIVAILYEYILLKLKLTKYVSRL